MEGGFSTRDGTVSVSNSTLSGNSAGNRGGGIYNTGTVSVVSVSNSTLSGNSVLSGGGIFNRDGTVSVSNSTLSGILRVIVEEVFIIQAQ